LACFSNTDYCCWSGKAYACASTSGEDGGGDEDHGGGGAVAATSDAGGQSLASTVVNVSLADYSMAIVIRASPRRPFDGMWRAARHTSNGRAENRTVFIFF